MNFDEKLTGAYVLLLFLPENQTIEVGKLGTFDFPAGWYTYVGSAFGSGACWAGSSTISSRLKNRTGILITYAGRPF